MKTLIINKNNVVTTDGTNSVFTYKFPVGAVKFENDQVAVSQLSIYYSWFNISSSTTNGGWNNNSFTYTWIDGSTHTITMTDGFYQITDINAYFQQQMVANTHYLLDSNGNYIYYMEWITNAVYYRVQLNCYNVPTSAQASALNYTQPSGATWSFPVSSTTPQVTVLSTNNFKSIVGLTAGTYPSTPQSTSFNQLGQSTPTVSPVSSGILQCTLLNNTFAIPPSLLFSFSPNVTFGSQIVVQPPQLSFVDVLDGLYTEFTVKFTDQNLNPLYINDPDLVLMLTIRNQKEISQK